MILKIAIAEDNSFLAKAVIEKLSYFNELDFKYKAVNGAELIGKLEVNHNINSLQNFINYFSRLPPIILWMKVALKG